MCFNSCSMNCAEKYAVTSKMNLYAVCLDCQPNEVPIFSWRLYKLAEEEEEEVDNFINMTSTGMRCFTDKTFVHVSKEQNNTCIHNSSCFVVIYESYLKSYHFFERG